MIVEKGDHLRDESMQKQVLTDFFLGNQLADDQQMPLLVVLLYPGFLDPVEDAPGKTRIGMGVRHGNIRHVLPSLIRHTGDDFEYLEFRHSFFRPYRRSIEKNSRRARKP